MMVDDVNIIHGLILCEELLEWLVIAIMNLKLVVHFDFRPFTTSIYISKNSLGFASTYSSKTIGVNNTSKTKEWCTRMKRDIKDVTKLILMFSFLFFFNNR